MILTVAGRAPRIGGSVFLAPSADIIGDVELAENSSVWFQCVLRGDIEPIRIGANSNIQDGTIIHTMAGAPTIVGDWVTVGHRVVLHGCKVGNQCLIGMGAVVLNHVVVGEGSIVAAGAVVAENTVIPPYSLFMGVPARRRREVTEKEQAFIRMHADHYLQYKNAYLAEAAK
ncbi:MAG TPA: gamma carbonic anhydrase family protein [Terriglobia bacterium]|nr:gamma carbonic anhydrase family protein [Terriglobia bacterium]